MLTQKKKINFDGNLNQGGGAIIFFMIEEAKKTF